MKVASVSGVSHRVQGSYLGPGDPCFYTDCGIDVHPKTIRDGVSTCEKCNGRDSVSTDYAEDYAEVPRLGVLSHWRLLVREAWSPRT